MRGVIAMRPTVSAFGRFITYRVRSRSKPAGRATPYNRICSYERSEQLQINSSPITEPLSSARASRERFQDELTDHLERVEDALASHGDGVEIGRVLDPLAGG